MPFDHNDLVEKYKQCVYYDRNMTPDVLTGLIAIFSKLGIIIKIEGCKCLYPPFVLIDRWILRQPLLSVLWPLQ